MGVSAHWGAPTGCVWVRLDHPWCAWLSHTLPASTTFHCFTKCPEWATLLPPFECKHALASATSGSPDPTPCPGCGKTPWMVHGGPSGGSPPAASRPFGGHVKFPSWMTPAFAAQAPRNCPLASGTGLYHEGSLAKLPTLSAQRHLAASAHTTAK